MSRCVMCNDEMTEGYGQVCYNCQHINNETPNRPTSNEQFFLNLRMKLFALIDRENIKVTNQNLYVLLERAFKEIK